ncbi:response regulator transcription factor [Glutamicibacter protophormiae]|uniref:Two-component system response regulator DesR n=1 Tax=Glutamicibacter protophormiae TaxID=37930 RepID=A0ABS4XLP4_GLUPR|nr:response regulator transcription factor [Glutamicibacter protophormiae]MBP2397426.1 two-component system response regulator DesR [Glutamicibacter protophormiae]GGL79328.1 DNA-binding response regulator [Glutamicibacter protophormiae]
MIKVLIADDQHLVRGALAALLNLEDDIQVVAECADGDEVAQALDDSGAQVALLDVQMPRMDGLRAAQLLRDSHPEVKILIVTTFDRPGYFRQAFEAGASGFLVKDSPPAELVAAIRRVHSGGKVVDPQRAMLSVETRANPLTEREREILALAAGGGPVSQIAAALNLSAGTVRNHLSNAIGKTNTSNRIEAARTAREMGWI